MKLFEFLKWTYFVSQDWVSLPKRTQMDVQSQRRAEVSTESFRCK